MRIESLTIKNFRQYQDLNLSFKKNNDYDLHIIIGKNGMGKTTLLNAINWCLYNEEPHSSKNDDKLPILNLKTINDSEIRDKQEVIVEIRVRTNEDHSVTFKRTEQFKILGEEKIPIPQSNTLKVSYNDEVGNMIFVDGGDAEYYAEHFVPSAIREFFFFDGERLDNYFKDNKAQNIKNQIFILSHIYLLDNMESRINQLYKEFKREAGKINPEIERKREEMEINTKNLDNTVLKIKKIKKQIDIAQKSINDYEDKLKGIPDASILEKEREGLKQKREKIESLKLKKEIERKNLLIGYAKIIMLWPSIENSLDIIEIKKKNKEIPPTIDTGLLERILEKEKCDVCGRNLDEQSKNKVNELLSTVKLSSNVVNLLHSMENPLINAESKLKSFKIKRKEIQDNIKIYKEDLISVNEKINKINQKLSGYDTENIKNWHNERLKLEDLKAQNIKNLGAAEENKKYLIKKIDELKEELDSALKKEKKAKNLRKQIIFCEKSLETIKTTKYAIMNETKNEIESETKKIFFDLLWKKETFKDVKIDENYNINLIHKMNYDCLGSVSAAERELLALSFTLALHKISGFDSPILIDTPVARVSDEHRENFANIFLEVSKNKQIILLLTPAEYSEDISDLLEEKVHNKYEINLLPGESVSKIGGII